jgi:1-acyl-sn-glycerol-3-phosphate acyltransferase
MHPDWVVAMRALSAPLYRHYFRVGSYGADRVPSKGPAILVANHAGTLPIDALMLCFDVLEHTEPPRIPRCITDRFVPKLPFVGATFSRLGAVNGTLGNVRHLLEAGELCLIFPEGLRAIGKPFRDRYRLQRWHVGHAELALRYRVPVIPVAIIGSEEQWPQLARIDAARLFGIPYLPIPATPLPLPVHYRIHYGTPMVNLLSLSDAARAIALAASSNATGVFNIPGCDTLPLSELIHRSGRFGLALPGPLLAPLYGLRAVVTPRRFRYGSDRKRFHYGTVLDGRKASRALGYVPESRLAFEGASELSAA